MATNLEYRIPAGVPLTNSQIDNNFHRVTWDKGTNLTAGTTLTLQDGYNYYVVDGTADISAIVGVCKGYVVRLRFTSDAATNGIVHGDVAPAIYCNSSGTNLTWKAGDIVTFIQDTDNNGGNALWYVQAYSRADGSSGFGLNPTTLNNAVVQDGTGSIIDAGVALAKIEESLSGQISISKSGTETYLHNLSGVPSWVTLWLECVSDDSLTGYVTGDWILYKSGGAFNNASSENTPAGVQVTFTTTQVIIQFSTRTEIMSLLHKTGGGEADITNTNAPKWKLHVNCYLIGTVIP